MIKNFISILYSKLLILVCIRHSTSVIPEGQYCYTPDYEKNKNAESFTYYVIPCKYYKTLGKRWNGCKYLGIITDDFVFDDQCKICNEKMIPIKFKESNKNLIKPVTMTDEECSSLWVYSDNKQCISCWKLNLIERLKVLLFGKVWLCIISGKTQPPVWLDCNKTVFNKK